MPRADSVYKEVPATREQWVGAAEGHDCATVPTFLPDGEARAENTCILNNRLFPVGEQRAERLSFRETIC